MARLFRIGDVCGGYQLLRFLGSGGFAEVYEAVDASGAHRAVKILTGQSPGARLGARLAREVEALARIEHVNVVRLYEAGIEDDRVYLVLELVLGSTLRKKLREPVPLGEVVRWMQKACEGVAEVHRVGVIHRDLKPANILVTPDGVVKVIDFGIAKLRSWSVPNPEHLVGTALYMSPEQLAGQPADARSDVYAMGVILYEALSGSHPLGLSEADASLFDVMQRQLRGEPAPLGELAPAVPAALAALVHAALARDPARRPGMDVLAGKLEHELGALSDEQRVSVPTPAPALPDAAVKTSPLAMTSPSLDQAPTPATAPSLDEERAAMPPPPPRDDRETPRRAVAARPAARAAAPAVDPSRPSTSRGSSAVPVVAGSRTSRSSASAPGAARPHLFRPLAAATVLLAALAVLWAATAPPRVTDPAPAASGSADAAASGSRAWPRPPRGCAR